MWTRRPAGSRQGGRSRDIEDGERSRHKIAARRTRTTAMTRARGMARDESDDRSSRSCRDRAIARVHRAAPRDLASSTSARHAGSALRCRARQHRSGSRCAPDLSDGEDEERQESASAPGARYPGRGQCHRPWGERRSPMTVVCGVGAQTNRGTTRSRCDGAAPTAVTSASTDARRSRRLRRRRAPLIARCRRRAVQHVGSTTLRGGEPLPGQAVVR